MELEGLLVSGEGSVESYESSLSPLLLLLLLRSTRTPLSASMLVDDHAAMMVEDPKTRNEVPGDTAAGATSPLSSASSATA